MTSHCVTSPVAVSDMPVPEAAEVSEYVDMDSFWNQLTKEILCTGLVKGTVSISYVTTSFVRLQNFTVLQSYVIPTKCLIVEPHVLSSFFPGLGLLYFNAVSSLALASVETSAGQAGQNGSHRTTIVCS